jgi:RNA polymerase sigma-70 factor (ECF subfamily)
MRDIEEQPGRRTPVRVAEPLEQEGLVERARTDPEAFACLYRRHYDAVFRYCVHRLFNRSLAEDVTAGVFLKVVEGIETFHGDDRDFECWLWRIATNAANEYLRRAARRKPLLAMLAADLRRQKAQVPEDQADAAERTALIKAALLDLAPRYQAVVTLHFFEHLSIAEVADITGASPATVRSRLSRALRQLRSRLEGLAGKGWLEE